MNIHRMFGTRIRELRCQIGMTQEKLGEAVGLSPISISNIERGVHAPSLKKLEDFAAALKVEVFELFLVRDRHSH